MAEPLVIDAELSDVRVISSALGLKNRQAVQDVIAHNKAVAADKQRKSAEVLDRAAEVGAEYIHDASNRTRTVSLEERMKHYHPNE